MNQLKKHVFITGVSQGLGRAMIKAFSTASWQVSGCATNAAALESLSSEITSEHFLQTCDVTDPAAVENLAQSVTARFGPPDLLINNAAIINPNKPLWETSPDEFSRVIDVNLKGVHLIIRSFLPPMLQRGNGIVVNISSGWGRSTSPEVAPYCATKWGIEGLTSALAQELPPGLAAIALNPGVIDTQMLRSCFGDAASEYPTPEQWTEVAVPFLASLNSTDNGKSLSIPSM